jgi:hypothetical protein
MLRHACPELVEGPVLSEPFIPFISSFESLRMNGESKGVSGTFARLMKFVAVTKHAFACFAAGLPRKYWVEVLKFIGTRCLRQGNTPSLAEV